MCAEIPTFGDKKTAGCTSSRDFDSKGGGGEGGSGTFCLKIDKVLTQQDISVSTILRSHFSGLIVKSAINITCLQEFLQFYHISAFGCFN